MSRFAAVLIPALLLTVVSAQQRSADPPVSPQQLAKLWDAEHVSPPLPPLITHADLVKRLEELTTGGSSLFRVEKVGESVEGRSLNLVQAGIGSFHVLLWSQMHGDEPTATAALFDLWAYLRKHQDDPPVRRMLSALTLHMVPMVNPDGAERFQRRNAQSIDINRDALRLQTPEGRTLKAVRDRFRPSVGFNLHNQSWRTSVGDPPKAASISLLSVVSDKARSNSPGRTLTKKLCAVIRDALEPFASGQIGRYDDEFEMRAFGDNITLWGTPVVLIETGAWPSEEPDPALVRLNFVAILTALDALATGAVNRADPDRYESLPPNESRVLYLLIRNASIINGAGVPPFVADIGMVANRRVRDSEGRRQLELTTTIEDMGDLRTLGALRTVDATGMTVVPLINDTLETGQIVHLPEWKTKAKTAVAVGQPARFALLKPAAEPGQYQVELVLK
ncbi:MAG: M14 family zinc carboxypeptidase [Vicinamibacterales bacterium]